MFKKRTLTSTVQQISQSFPVLLITGPRQVGKTTLLESCAEKNRSYVTLDDLDARSLAQKDPTLFLQKYKPPLIIDEIQYAPQLLSAIKLWVDQQKIPGLFWLTGSQKFHLMQDITETLAGRVAIIDMLGLSQAEWDNRADQTLPFLPTQAWLDQVPIKKIHSLDLSALYQRIWRGAFPKLLIDSKMSRDIFYNSYIQTYIQRDVRDLTRVGNERTFYRFLRVIAARTGQLLNYADLARDADIDAKTAKAWLGILETSGLIYLLMPYYANIAKRLVKTPKLYFLDAGLCSYLAQWTSPETLESGAMSGAIFETYVVIELLKSYWHRGLTPHFYFYRDKDQKEIDLIIEQDNTLYPVEIRKTATPSKNAAANFSLLNKLNRSIGEGAVICMRSTPIPLAKGVQAIPVVYL